MTPDPAPTVQQLLAFYMEAGVDCALTEEPVNRLSDPDMIPAAPRETAPPNPVNPTPPTPTQTRQTTPHPTRATPPRTIIRANGRQRSRTRLFQA